MARREAFAALLSVLARPELGGLHSALSYIKFQRSQTSSYMASITMDDEGTFSLFGQTATSKSPTGPFKTFQEWFEKCSPADMSSKTRFSPYDDGRCVPYFHGTRIVGEAFPGRPEGWTFLCA